MMKDEELKYVVGGNGGGGYSPTPTPSPTPPTDGQTIANRAVAEIGKPYIWGAAGPEGYDCAGLVSYAVSGAHIMIGTTTTFLAWPEVDNPSPGDICVNGGHCGIYIGNGQMVHAPTFGQNVCVSGIQGGMKIVRKP